VQTLKVGDFAGGKVIFQIDYEEANDRVVAFRCINHGTLKASGTMMDEDNNIIGQAEFLPREEPYNIPVLNGRKMTFTEDGPIVPYNFSNLYPA
jgi:hypothetical protein